MAISFSSALACWRCRDDFRNALPQLLRGEDLQFQHHLRRIANHERGGLVHIT